MLELIISKINDFIWGVPFVSILAILGIYLTIKLKMPQIKSFLSIKGLFSKEDKNSKITPFKALMSILAGTLGIGNITGVASAIIIGGIGSIFWLFVSGFIAVAISYAENYLVLKNRKYDSKSGTYGGAMYILDEVLEKRKIAELFCIFTLFATVGMGAMVQSNSLTKILTSNFSLSGTFVAITLTIIAGYIVLGGKYRIAKINSVLIPVCTIIYVCLCLGIIFLNIDNIGFALKNILLDAFGFKPVVGAVVGISIMKCISTGFCSGMFSNEAGMGSAPIFSACTEEDKDVKKLSYIMSYSVFVDTIFLCVLTGITIAVSNSYMFPNVIDMLNNTFGTVPFGNILLIICMAVFVIATIPCWEFYGEQVIKFLFGKKYNMFLFKIIYLISVYFGCLLSINIVWDLSNISNALMAIPNIYMIVKLRNTIES
ncbi:MAG: sodium:alanine symporter family protein [Clostridia bacterium]|nr:sodium:alanine symporter family protein [Clostridia bacterium]